MLKKFLCSCLLLNTIVLCRKELVRKRLGSKRLGEGDGLHSAEDGTGLRSIRKTPVRLFGNWANPTYSLSRCEGDCESDAECSGSLRCYQRSGTSSVPGCSGSGRNDWDYCITGPTGQHLWDNGQDNPVNHYPLGRCEGECDSDSQCRGGLVCYQRSGTSSVPGCSGSGRYDYDYCIDGPDGENLFDNGQGNPVGRYPLGRCEGDCDRDSQCGPGLVCFHRHGTNPVPGCIGSGRSSYDYCIGK